jgi:hypothetical protein
MLNISKNIDTRPLRFTHFFLSIIQMQAHKNYNHQDSFIHFFNNFQEEDLIFDKN